MKNELSQIAKIKNRLLTTQTLRLTKRNQANQMLLKMVKMQKMRMGKWCKFDCDKKKSKHNSLHSLFIFNSHFSIFFVVFSRAQNNICIFFSSM